EAQKAVLHTTFTEITRGLVEAWSLGPFIREVVAPGQPGSMASSLVRNAVEMAKVSEAGWSGPDMDKVLDKLSKDVGETPAAIRDQLKLNAQEATKVAVSLGIPQVTALLPGNQGTEGNAAEAPPIDPDLQLQILRDLTQTLAEKPDINEVCQLVIEGIHRAVGMQRVALLMSDRTGLDLVPRKVGGRGTEEWRQHLIIRKDGTGLLGELLPHGTCAIYKPGKHPEGVALGCGWGKRRPWSGESTGKAHLWGWFNEDIRTPGARP